MQHPGATTFDAAALLMPLVRFVSPTDPRWISTLRGIEQELVSDSLVYRYRLGESFSDGLTGQEGTFSMCSFWYVECLLRMGDLPKARFFFEEDAWLRESPGIVRRGIGAARAAPRQLSAGLHTSGADQRRLRSRPAALGGGPDRLTTCDVDGAGELGLRVRRQPRLCAMTPAQKPISLDENHRL